MGTSVKRLEERKGLPWPRYRVATWSEVSAVWKEIPTVYYEHKVAAAVAEALEAKGHKVRLCIMHNDGRKQDLNLEAFKGVQHGQTQGEGAGPQHGTGQAGTGHAV